MLTPSYPNRETNKENLIISSIFGALSYLLLIIYQPFGTSQFEHLYKYLLLFPYALICTVSIYSVNSLIFTQKRKWTINLEFYKVLSILFLISSTSYFYNTLFLSKVKLSLINYLYMFGYTMALGLPLAVIYILARYIYLTKKTERLSKTTISDYEFITKSKNCYENKEKLTIVFGYSKYNLKMRQEDFIYAKAADNYCLIYFYKSGVVQKEMLRISLTKLLEQIQTDSIKKIHRSFIVNLKKVSKFKGNASGYKIYIDNIDKELVVSRKHIHLIVPFMKNLVIRP